MSPEKLFCMKKTIMRSCAICILLFVVAGCACAPREATVSNGSTGGSTDVPIEWSTSSDCLSCHTAEAATVGDSSCLAGAHKASGAICISCHVDTDGLSNAHEKMNGASPAEKLKKTKVLDAGCLECHVSYEFLIEKTSADGITLTDKNGKEINPHSILGLSKSHMSIGCTDCHVVHVQNADAMSNAQEVCISCHHSNVFECGTCHE